MTPQEKQMIADLFDRLAQMEGGPRDAAAAREIENGLVRAPDALYPLVQTVLVQDEALKRAEARIRELGGEVATPAGGGFLDSMRQTLTGNRATSVPSVRAASNAPDPRWNSGGAMPPQAATQMPPQAGVQSGVQAAPQAQPQGGSFLGTAAATAAGVIGGSLLFNSLGGMFGHNNSGSAFGNTRPDASPWGDNAAGSAANSNLSRDAGLNDVGTDRHAGLFDAGADDAGDIGGDFGADFGGDA